MPLTLVATPIGNPDDLSARALESLQKAQLVVGEERKPLAALLRSKGITGKNFELLNEHSSPEEEERLLEACRQNEVVLMSDCGTPGFCDPGARLVDLCYKAGIPVTSIPGPSSLMTLISLCGVQLREFDFKGFPPLKSEERPAFWGRVGRSFTPVFLMDTPYRLKKVLQELAKFCPRHFCVLGLDLTTPSEKIIRAEAQQLERLVDRKKAEFICLVLPLGFQDRNTGPDRRGSGSRNPPTGSRPS